MSTLKGKSLASKYKNILQTSSEVNSSTLKQVETGSGLSTSMKLASDKVEFLKVGVGTGGSTPDGLLHLMTTSAGAVTANSSADEFVIENVGSCGMSMLSGASGLCSIYFGDVNDNDVGQIVYDHSSDSFNFHTNGSVSMTLDKSSNLNVVGSISEGDERYRIEEYFDKLPSVERYSITQSSSGTTAVTANFKFITLTTATIDLAATDSVEFTLNNAVITSSSHVLVYLYGTSATVADNAIINVMAHSIADGSCKIRLATNATDIASMTFSLFVEVDPHIIPNQNFVLSGTSAAVDASVSWATSHAGINILTGTSDNDNCILAPRTTTAAEFGGGGEEPTAWTGIKFGTENKTQFKAAISTDSSIADLGFWAGLKLTTVGAYASDANQAYFLYASDDTLGALTTNGNLHFVYSVAGTDYITDLGVAVAANTTYRLRISIDENRKLSVFVNNVQYGLVTTATAGGAVQSVSTTRSLALTDDIDLLPVAAVQTFTTAAKSIQVHYVKMERDLFE